MKVGRDYWGRRLETNVSGESQPAQRSRPYLKRFFNSLLDGVAFVLNAPAVPAPYRCSAYLRERRKRHHGNWLTERAAHKSKDSRRSCPFACGTNKPLRSGDPVGPRSARAPRCVRVHRLKDALPLSAIELTTCVRRR